MAREVETRRFKALGDSGNEYTIIEYQNFIPAPTLNSPDAEIPGMKRLITTSGLAVNYIDPKTFKIVIGNEIVRKIG